MSVSARSLVVCLLLPLLVAGCGGGGSEGAKNAKLPPCDIDVDRISGDWVAVKGTGSSAQADKFTRVHFAEEGGKKVAYFTGGKIFPDNPATNKWKYEFVEKAADGTLHFQRALPFIQGKDAKRVERLKKDNREKARKFESRLVVKKEPRMCVLEIAEKNRSYVKGVAEDEPGQTGERQYTKIKEELSHVHCADTARLIPYDKAEVDVAKDQPLDPNTGVIEQAKVFFHWSPKTAEGLEGEALTKSLLESGAKATEGCTYDFEMWMRDVRVLSAQKIPVTPKEDGTLPWIWETNFEKSSADGIFVEMHRYATCGGERKLLTNACNVVRPERKKEETPAPGAATPGAPGAAAAPVAPAAPKP